MSFWRANFSIAPLSSLRNQSPMKPGTRISRPMNMLSAIESAGDSARFW